MPNSNDPDSAAPDRALLARLGASMTATGQPVHEIEEELIEVGAALGYPNLQVGVAPTSVTVALDIGAPATFQKASAPLRLDQASDVRRIRYQLVHRSIENEAAFGELAELASRPPRYSNWLTTPALVAVAVGIALVLQPGWANLAVTAVAAVVVVTLMRLSRHSRLLATLLPSVAALLVSLLVFGAASAGWVEGPLRTTLPPLAVLLPGALLVTGMSELAAGHMLAGSARLIFGSAQLGLFTLGLLAGVALLDAGGVTSTGPLNVRVDEIGLLAAPVGLVVIAVGICLMESVNVRMLPWVLFVVVLAFAAQSTGQHLGSLALGGLLGGIAASLGATLVELLRPQVARLVLFLPAFWLLVPGSLGLVGASELALQPGTTTQSAMTAIAVVSALALGLLVGSSLGQALRSWLRPASKFAMVGARER